MAKMNAIGITAIILVLIGAVTWGLVGFFGYNLVEAIFKTWAKYVYDLVGIAGIYLIYALLAD